MAVKHLDKGRDTRSSALEVFLGEGAHIWLRPSHACRLSGRACPLSVAGAICHARSRHSSQHGTDDGEEQSQSRAGPVRGVQGSTATENGLHFFLAHARYRCTLELTGDRGVT